MKLIQHKWKASLRAWKVLWDRQYSLLLAFPVALSGGRWDHNIECTCCHDLRTVTVALLSDSVGRKNS